MKTAYTGWMWVREHEGNREKFRKSFIQSVIELAYLRYDTLENWTFIQNYFSVKEVLDICSKYSITISCLYANLDEGIEQLKRDVDYIAAINATWMICASPNWPIGMEHNSPMDRSEIQREADMLNQLGVYAKERHVTILHNPHSYTPVCRRQDIDYLMKITDPSLVKLCVDSGHSVVAGVDAIALLRDYAERVEYIHLKDLNTTKKDRGRGKNWVPLGMGTVNLPLFMKTLGDINYQGVVCVGLPTGCERINRFESARISRNYLWQTFGL